MPKEHWKTEVHGKYFTMKSCVFYSQYICSVCLSHFESLSHLELMHKGYKKAPISESLHWSDWIWPWPSIQNVWVKQSEVISFLKFCSYSKTSDYAVFGSIKQISAVEGVLLFGECEHRSFQWPRVSLVTRELSKYGFGLSGKGSSILPLKQTNIQNTQLG